MESSVAKILLDQAPNMNNMEGLCLAKRLQHKEMRPWVH